MSLNGEYVSQLGRISPNLKLPGKDIIRVLQRIHSAQPRRDQVERAVMKEFPGKDPKGTFRAMVVPTTKRFHLVRVRPRKSIVNLAPNGRGGLFPDNQKERKQVLRRVIRDYAVIVARQSADSLRYFEENEGEFESEYPAIHEKTKRFINSYLDEFGVELPQQRQVENRRPIEVLYRGDSLWKQITDENHRRDWIVRALPDHQFQQMDKVRWRLIHSLLKEGYIGTSWLVDEALAREWRSENPIIDMWKSSTHSNRKLVIDNESYEAVVLIDG